MSLGAFLGLQAGLVLGIHQETEIRDGTYQIVASGKEVRLLEQEEELVILRGVGAQKLPERGTFTRTTVVTSEKTTTITPSK